MAALGLLACSALRWQAEKRTWSQDGGRSRNTKQEEEEAAGPTQGSTQTSKRRRTNNEEQWGADSFILRVFVVRPDKIIFARKLWWEGRDEPAPQSI